MFDKTPTRLTQIGQVKGYKFIIKKEEDKHLLVKFMAGQDGFGIRREFLDILKDIKKTILIQFHRLDGTTQLLVTSPDNWLKLGHPFQLANFEKQIFLALKDFEITVDGSEEGWHKYEEFTTRQSGLEKFVGG